MTLDFIRNCNYIRKAINSQITIHILSRVYRKINMWQATNCGRIWGLLIIHVQWATNKHLSLITHTSWWWIIYIIRNSFIPHYLRAVKIIMNHSLSDRSLSAREASCFIIRLSLASLDLFTYRDADVKQIYFNDQ